MRADERSVFPKDGEMSVFVSGFCYFHGESEDWDTIIKKNSKTTYYSRAHK
jgi:hypothetical protein